MNIPYQRILVIQTAFIGDVVLATSVVEKLHRFFPTAKIDFLVRKGCESLLLKHPFLHEILVWDKKTQKRFNLLKTLKNVRQNKYYVVINLQRFSSSGIVTTFSGATQKIGYECNPFSVFFTKRIEHRIGDKKNPGLHEVDRCLKTIEHLTDASTQLPRVYPSSEDQSKTAAYQTAPYITISPASVWFTKQTPMSVWSKLISSLAGYKIYLLGGPDDSSLCHDLKLSTLHPGVEVLAGKLSLLESAALLKNAKMNYTNDSAPLHLCTATSAPVTAVFCSTIPEFGFGPVGSAGRVVQTSIPLTCKPCGHHGHNRCPEGHFRCGVIETAALIDRVRTPTETEIQ